MKILLIVTSVIVSQNSLQGQNNIYSKFQVAQKIPLEIYSKRSVMQFKELALPEISGLGFIDNKYTYWTNQQGLLTVWDMAEDIYIYNCFLDNELVFNTLYDSLNHSLFLNKFNDKSWIDIHNMTQECQLLNSLNPKSNATYRTLALSSNSKQVVAIQDSTIFYWLKKSNEWTFEQKSTREHFFEVAFLNDNTLLAGCDNGDIVIYEIPTFQIRNKIKAHSSTVGIIEVANNGQHFASTEGKTVKIWDKNKSFYTITPNMELISALKWLDDDNLIIAGNNNGIEIWNAQSIKEKKMLQSFNVSSKQVNHQKVHNKLPTGRAYLFVKNNLSIDSLKLSAKVRSLRANKNQLICLGYETTYVEVYDYKNRLNLLNSINVVDHFEKNILDATTNLDGSYVYVGYDSGFECMDFKNENKVAAWESKYFGDINITYDDVALLYRHKSKVYKPGLEWIKKPTKEATKESELYREIKNVLPAYAKKRFYDYLPNLKSMQDPSGYDVSNDTKYLAQYDSIGNLQVLQVKGLKLIIDTLINISIKKAYFNYQSDKLWLTSFDNRLYMYDFLKNRTLSFEKRLPNQFDKIAFNKKTLLAFYNAQEIYVYDLQLHKIIDKITNNRDKFSIEKVEFIGQTSKIAWVMNENSSEKTLQKNQEAPNFSEYYGTITRIAISPDKKQLLLGNSLGEILRFKR